MSRTSRPRAAVAAGMTLGATAASIFLAPAAFAAPQVAEAAGDEATFTTVETAWEVDGPESVVAGATFALSGTDCFYRTGGDDLPAGVLIGTDIESENPEEFLFEAEPNEAGAWSTDIFFPANTPAGEHTVQVSCLKSYNGSTEIREETYVDLVVNVTAPGGAVQPVNNPNTPAASPTATPAATTPAAAFKPGVKPNTAGVSSTTTDKTTGAAAAPGQKVVKVLKGFKAGEKVTVVLHSEPVVLGVFTADANGVVTVEFTVPVGTPLGNHTIAYTGDQGTYFEEALQLTADGKALAYTGASIAMPLIGGSVLLAAGAGAMVVGRRRRTAGAVQA